MSSVLHRSSDLLSLLGSDPQRLFTVAEAAETLALPTATCQRLLADLVRLGWADQPGRRKGYRLGPRAYALTTAQPYRAALMERVRLPAAALADELDRLVVVAALRGSARQTLCSYEPGGLTPVGRGPMESDDIYSTSGGRVLLAMLPTAERQYLLARLGMPDARQWPSVVSPQELHDELAEIRRERVCSITRRQGPVRATVTMSAAFPDGEGGWAAIGCFGPVRGWNNAAHARVCAVAASLGVDQTT